MLKPANKQFSNIKNEYEMTMTNETVIQECQDADTNIPQTQFDFTSIDKIANIEVGTLIGMYTFNKKCVCLNSNSIRLLLDIKIK